jgi:hypothetical protein
MVHSANLAPRSDPRGRVLATGLALTGRRPVPFDTASTWSLIRADPVRRRPCGAACGDPSVKVWHTIFDPDEVRLVEEPHAAITSSACGSMGTVGLPKARSITALAARCADGYYRSAPVKDRQARRTDGGRGQGCEIGVAPGPCDATAIGAAIASFLKRTPAPRPSLITSMSAAPMAKSSPLRTAAIALRLKPGPKPRNSERGLPRDAFAIGAINERQEGG